MDATCWSDYLCPWCYVGQHRDRLLTDLGVAVTHLPYELHPEIPPEGRTVRPDGRLRTTFDRLEDACDEADMPFRRPTRMPNTRRALETAEWVRQHQPDAFAEVHRGLFHAHFVTGDPIDDPGVVDDIVAAAGGDATAAHDAVATGQAAPLVDKSMADAKAAGITSTPTWLVGGRLTIPGALDPDTVTRWVSRLIQRDQSSA